MFTVKNSNGNENRLSSEIIAKAKEAQSAVETLVLAKENGIEMTDEQAAEIYADLNKTGLLLDDELDNVAGGG